MKNLIASSIMTGIMSAGFAVSYYYSTFGDPAYDDPLGYPFRLLVAVCAGLWLRWAIRRQGTRERALRRFKKLTGRS